MVFYLTPFLPFHLFFCSVEDLPELGEILQRYIDDNIRQIDIPDRIEKDHGIKMR